MNTLVLLNLDTTVNGLLLTQGSTTDFTCTIDTPGCIKVSGLTNEGGAKINFEDGVAEVAILQKQVRDDYTAANAPGISEDEKNKLIRGSMDDLDLELCIQGKADYCTKYQDNINAGRLVLLI